MSETQVNDITWYGLKILCIISYDMLWYNTIVVYRDNVKYMFWYDSVLYDMTYMIRADSILSARAYLLRYSMVVVSHDFCIVWFGTSVL